VLILNFSLVAIFLGLFIRLLSKFDGQLISGIDKWLVVNG